MPDTVALDMPAPRAISADLLPVKEGPSLSATSDMPVTKAEPVATVETKVETPKPDEKPAPTEAKAPDKAAAEVKADPEKAKVEAAEVKEPDKKDETPPWMKREITRAKNETRAQLDARVAAEARADRAEKALTRALELAEKATGEPAKQADRQANTEDPRPKRETFDNPDAYDAALDTWMGRTAQRAAESAINRQKASDAEAARVRAETEQLTRTESEYRELGSKWQQKADALRQSADDFDDAVFNPDNKITVPMSDAILRADNGPAIAYHLGKNPAEIERIANLPVSSQPYEIGRLSLRLENEEAARATKEAEAKISKVPEPIKPVTTANGYATSKSPDDESMEEYAARRQAEIAARRKTERGAHVN